MSYDINRLENLLNDIENESKKIDDDNHYNLINEK